MNIYLLFALLVTGVTSYRVINDVTFTIDERAKYINVSNVNGIPADIHLIPANGQSNGWETLDILHHYPGVATNIPFGPVHKNSTLNVVLSNGAMLRVYANLVYTNFHSHKNRMIYGQLSAFAVKDMELANSIYMGAPIYYDNKFVSVVTCRYDDYNNKASIFAVSAPSSSGLVSGHINYDDTFIHMHDLHANMSVYGKKQLPYTSVPTYAPNIKRYALSINSNKNLYRDSPRAISIFHNNQKIIITLTENEFEITRVSFDGPLIQMQTSSS